MRDSLNFTFTGGYFDTGNYVEVPEGSFIYPSSNVIFDAYGRLFSFKGFSTTYSGGGTRAFVLDSDTAGFLGTDVTSNAAVGNIIQGVEKSLWFVGNGVTNGVKVVDLLTGTSKNIGGTARAESVTVTVPTAVSHGLYTVGNDPTLDYINLTGHNFVEGQKVVLSGTPPVPLVAGTTYYVKSPITDAFKLSSTSGGGAIDITGATTTFTLSSPQILVKVTSTNMSSSPVSVLVEINSSAETATTVATKIREALRSNSVVANTFFATSSSAKVTLTYKDVRTDNFNVEIASNLNGINTVSSSTVEIAGTLGTSTNLSSIPQVARWNGTGWDNPTQVGMRAFEDADKPSLELTTTSTRSTGFDGLVKGSRSVRVARKRYESVSIATPSSEVVTASETGDSLVVSIPALDDSTIPVSKNSWILYFTYKGQGSTATHKQFPIEISEAQLSGLETAELVVQGNAKYKVISQGATQASRLVEVEFNDNELFPIEPNDDTYSLEACKFIAKLGNVMCGIGVGDDSTGFDVSYPNEYEAYPPDWRDWFAEVPVGVAPQEDMGFFWVASANNTYIAKWTGVTEGSAPVVIEKLSNLLGVIGERALVSVNGVLYMLSKGKIPVAISPDGQVNDTFGASVLKAFSNYTSDTHVAFDTLSNTIVFSCGTSAIGFHVAANKWTAPVTLGETARSAFTYNGAANLCFYSSGAFSTKKWNGGTDPTDSSWNVTSAFQYGNYGRSLKDIIQVETVLSSEVNSGTITFGAYKNFNVSSLSTLATQTVSATGSMITIRQYAEDLDYDVISAKISGTKGGQTIHSAMYTVDVHRLERLS